ncbi:MAG: polyprenyl synthetase family protein [Opitutales bacterium]
MATYPAHPADVEALERCWSQALQQLKDRARTATTLAPLADTLTAFLVNTGKRFRPRLCLGAYRVFAEDAPPQPETNVVQAAVGLELFHSFALIHDDLIDGSPTRRGQPSLHRRLSEALETSPQTGERLALLAGDLLFGMAWEAIAQLAHPPASAYFARVAQDTGWGEAHEVINAAAPLSTLSRDAIFDTYLQKTTRYSFEAPLMLGAMAAGAGAPVAAVLRRMAEPLGLAFQAENDLHEIERLLDGESRRSCDLNGGVKTIVLKEASLRLNAPERAELDALLQNPATDAAMARVAALVDASGAVTAIREMVDAQFEATRQALEDSAIEPAQRGALSALVQFARENLRHSESLTPVA